MLTLKELKKVVKVAGMTKRVPSEKALEKEEIVVKEILSGECDITVYANGYVLYRENGKKTIFPLHSCKDYQYMDVKEDRSIMNEEFFDNENWYIRLLMEATDRMEINQTTDDIIIDGKQFYLMEHQEYHRQVAYIILDSYGKMIMEECKNGFDEKTKQKLHGCKHRTNF